MKKRSATLARANRAQPKRTRAPEPAAETNLTPDLLRKIDAYWRAANYLSVGQIYLCLGSTGIPQPLAK
jgi:phosphoketolase